MRPPAALWRLALLGVVLAAGAFAQEALPPGAKAPLEEVERPLEPPRLEGPPVEAESPKDAAGSARVVLELVVDAQGLPAEVRAITPPQPGFDEAALAAARRLRFSPARRGGTPVPVRIQYAFNFAAPAPKPPPPEAGPVSLSGTVRERGTRRRLSGIEVLAAPPGAKAGEAGAAAVTDAAGRFELRGLPAGEVEVVIAAPGYQRFSARETLAAGRAAEATYLIEALFGSPFEATVEGERQRRELSRTQISLAEVNRVPGAQGDALKVIEDLPGVARTSPIGGGFLVIRGSAPGDSLVFLDGLQIPLLYHFGALSSTVAPDLLSAIDYLPGNFSVQYGDLIGGLVEVRSRSLRDEPHGFANLNLLEASGLFETALPAVPGLRLSVSGRRSYIDYVLRAVVPKDGDVSLTAAPRYYDAQVRLDYAPEGSAHELQFLALTSDDALGVLIRRPLEQDPNVSGSIDAETGFSQLRLKHLYRSGAFSLETLGMYEHLVLGFAVGNESFSLRGNGLSLRSLASWEPSDRVGLSWGYSVAQRHALVSARFRQSLAVREGDPPAPPRPDQGETVLPATPFDRVNPAVFAEARLRVAPGLTATPGVRFDAFAYSPDQPRLTTTLSPRLAARWELNDALAIKGGIGLTTQGARNGDPTAAFGNPAVLPERALQSTLGIELRPTPGLLFTAEAFDKRLRDLIVRSGSSTPGQLLDNAGKGRIYGLELLLRRELTERLFGWIALTLSHSERVDRPGQPTRLFDFDQPVNLVAVASYRLPGGWQVGGRLRVISGNPDTPVLGARYLAQSDTYLPLFGPTNSTRLPLFHQLDLRVDKVWTWDAWQLDLYLDVLNLYNHRSIEGTQYSYDYSQSAQFRGLPILPTLGLKGSF